MSSRMRLALALLLPFLAAAVQWQLWDPWINPYVWFLFFPTAFFSAWLGGMSGGIASTVISTLLVWYFFIPPRFSFVLESASSGFSIVVFVLMGCLFAWFHDMLRRALHTSESRFEATFERAAVGIALVAPDGQWIRVNQQLCSIVGYTESELLSKTFQDITHPDDLAADLALVQRMLAREIDTYSLEKRYIRKGGGMVWINLTVALVWTKAGAADYFISVIEDISLRKRAEQRFAQLFEQAPVAMSTSNREGRVTLMNQAFVELFGYRLEDIPTVDAWRTRVVLDKNQRAIAAADWQQKWQLGRQAADMVEYPVLCSNGQHKTVLMSRMRLGEEMMLVAIDITLRKEAEEQAARHLEALERFHRGTVGRELDMIRLKREVNAMALELGRPPPYDIAFADASPSVG